MQPAYDLAVLFECRRTSCGAFHGAGIDPAIADLDEEFGRCRQDREFRVGNQRAMGNLLPLPEIEIE